MAIFQAPLTRLLVVHHTHEYSKSVRSINDLLFRRGRAGEWRKELVTLPDGICSWHSHYKSDSCSAAARPEIYIFNGPSILHW
jgi:hypothetical protein